jgi:hypothetical protein
MESPLVGIERRQVLEEPPVATPVDRRIDALRGEAVIARDRRRVHE